MTMTSAASSSRCSVEQAVQRVGAELLLALDEDDHADRQVVAEGAQRGDVRHDAGLVVGGAAAVEPAVALGGLERARSPTGRGRRSAARRGGRRAGRSARRAGPACGRSRRAGRRRSDDPVRRRPAAAQQFGDGVGGALDVASGRIRRRRCRGCGRGVPGRRGRRACPRATAARSSASVIVLVMTAIVCALVAGSGASALTGGPPIPRYAPARPLLRPRRRGRWHRHRGGAAVRRAGRWSC